MTETTPQARKPRVALMGEFSAGKSTLLNMLLSRAPLPVQITATSVPPVWLSYGDEAAICIGHDGGEKAIDLHDINDIDLEETQYVRVFLKADLLEICDLFDMPGISDPNMSPEIWRSVFDKVDHVVWCTHATQAWRQSEAATWDDIKDRIDGQNIMVVTQIDKIRTSRDRDRLMSRLNREAGPEFTGVFPVAALEASTAKDEDTWKQSGAAEFANALIDMMLGLNTTSKEETCLDGEKEASADTITADKSGDADDQVAKISPRRVNRATLANTAGVSATPPKEIQAVTDMSNAG